MVAAERVRTHVIAILGTSPAVLTELLWWLVKVDRSHVAGVEVWTTDGAGSSVTGVAALRRQLENGFYGSLLRALGRDGRHVPPEPSVPLSPRRPEQFPPLDAPGLDARPFLIGQLVRGPHALEDVRDQEDAHAVAALLHDRVRRLRGELPGQIQLVGSLAGGRKTMSAALQGAFQLQAWPGDRLLHTLTHPRLEEPDLRSTFVVPTKAVERQTGVPVRDQVQVYDVPFPLIRELARDQDLPAVLDRHGYDAVIQGLRSANLGAERRARLRRPAHGSTNWALEIISGDKKHAFGLTEVQAQTYYAICSFREGARDREWWDLLVKSGVKVKGGGRRDRALEPYESEAYAKASDNPVRNDAAQRYRRLAEGLRDLKALSFSEFFPETVGTKSNLKRWIAAADRVDLCEWDPGLS